MWVYALRASAQGKALLSPLWNTDNICDSGGSSGLGFWWMTVDFKDAEVEETALLSESSWQALVLHGTQTNLGNRGRFWETDISRVVKIERGLSGWTRWGILQRDHVVRRQIEREETMQVLGNKQMAQWHDAVLQETRNSWMLSISRP